MVSTAGKIQVKNTIWADHLTRIYKSYKSSTCAKVMSDVNTSRKKGHFMVIRGQKPHLSK